MNRLVMYYHAGSKNHGCEAIVRSTKKIINKDMILYSSQKEEDYEYGLQEIVKVEEDVPTPIEKNSIKFIIAAISHKLRKNDYRYITTSHKSFFDDIKKGDICLSIGGDNYCYKGRDILGYYNLKLHKKGAKTILWGCSFDPNDLTPEIEKDLALYDLIVARERISYNTLKKINSNTLLMPDPAFQLDSELLPLPKGFIEGNTIGINLSPLVGDYANSELIMNNYRVLINYIIENTDSNIALIPHVVKNGNDDRTVLKVLYDEFNNTDRIILFEDCNCLQLKGFISRCRFFIGARTHSTIAAYSTCVPTLVVGYSVKARGIAIELFGTDDNYVIPVQSLKNKYELKNAFSWLMDNEQKIKLHLEKIMPEYTKNAYKSKEALRKLEEKTK